MTLTLLHSLGIQVNWKKSHLDPTQHIHFVGAILDPQATRAFLPLDRAQTLWHHIQHVRAGLKTTAFKVQQILGHMAAAIAVVPFARLHMSPLQMVFLRQFRPQMHSQSCRIFLKKGIRDSLRWWTVPNNILMGTPFRKPNPTMTLTTDALLTGWGAHLEHWSTRGLWSTEEAKKCINLLELKTTLLGVTAFAHLLKDKAVAIHSDNKTAVSYINKNREEQYPAPFANWTCRYGIYV